jgi:hypothetical protein
MVEKEVIIQWLEDAESIEAANVLAECRLGYEWVDILFEMAGNREYDLYDVRIEAPHRILSQIDANLASEKEEVEEAVRGCMRTISCVVRSFEWVPKLPEASPAEPTGKEEGMMDTAFSSWFEDLDNLVNDSTMTPEQKASEYLTWYYRVDQQLAQISILSGGPDNACQNLWREAEGTGFVTDYRHRPSIDSLIRAARTALQAYKDSLENTEPVVGKLFPLEVVEKVRGYAEDVARQANGCYEKGWYDACAVMVRRLIEILVIDCFEVHGILNGVKDAGGSIFGLSRLVDRFLQEPDDMWHVERSARPAMRKLKKIGDRAAHGRYHKTQRQSLDRYKDSLEVALQQLAGIIESASGR